MSDFDSDSDDVESNFNAAAEFLQKNHTRLDPTDLLEMYALYKQATIGKCNTSKPGLFSIQARSKWNAWNDLKDLASEQAKQMYYEKLEVIIPGWQQQAGAQAVGNKKDQSWMAVSTLQTEAPIPDAEKNILDYVKENNLVAIRDGLSRAPAKIKMVDENGMGLLHWASDRGHAKMLDTLLKFGACIDAVDNDGQTALHYAASCGHASCVRVLINNGANRHATDSDDQTCVDVAFSVEIADLLQQDGEQHSTKY